MPFIYYLGFFSAFSFIFYGISCLFTQKMKLEFNRFGLQNWQRKLTGILQLLGAIGLITGLLTNEILSILASGGLSLLMILGVSVRIKIKDPFLEMLPAAFFALLNFIITYQLISIYPIDA